ncbi:hypothetical protein GGR54DRAFT_96941 [Hypoxylon sp. NC1633]|nr:hypothetical protein GGR54DRAFT_96941 [Hypoxylon sp. NC1633]
MLPHAFSGLVILLATSFVTIEARQDHVHLEYRQLSAWNSTTTPGSTSAHVSGVTPSTTSGSTTDIASATTGATILQQTTTSNGQVQTIPLMVGGIFTGPVTLESPNPTPLDPTGAPAKSSAELISKTYSSILADITSWVQAEPKDQAQATAIRDNLQIAILPILGSMVNNLPDGPQNLGKSSDCQRRQKKHLHERDLLGNLFGSLNDMLCSTTVLIDSFTNVTQTTNSVTISNLASGIIQSTIAKINVALSGIVTGGGDDTLDPSSISTQSTQSTDSTTSSSSSTSSTSCTQTITATFQSVFCTSTTVPVPGSSSSLRRRQECSSLIYSTVTGCSTISNSATTTTTTIQAQTTPYNPFCTPGTCGTQECSTKRSIEEDSSLSKQNSRDLKRRAWEKAPKRTSDPPNGYWANTKNYKVPKTELIRGEVALAYKMSGINPTLWGSVALSPGLNSYTGLWGEEALTVALSGLYGCTSIVILSQRGVWISQMWEVPFFTGLLIDSGYVYKSGETFKWAPPFYAKATKDGIFQREVLNAIHTGRGDDYHRFGLDQLRTPAEPVAQRDLYSSMFDDVYTPEAFIITPKPLPPIDAPDREQLTWTHSARDYRYPDELKKIQDELNSIFKSGIPQTVIGYNPLLAPFKWLPTHTPQEIVDYERDIECAKVSGKVLVQFQHPIRNPKDRKACGTYEYRMLFEGQQMAYKPVVKDPVQKRDNSSACDIPASVSSTSVPASQTSTLTTPTTTTPTVPSSTGLHTTAPASPVDCYNSLELSCYHDVDPDTAHSKSDKFCSDHASIIELSNGPEIQYTSNEFLDLISYYWKISRKPNCVADQVSVGQPIPGFSCPKAMRLAFDGCNNGGHGGTVEVGCLVYRFNPVNRYDGGEDDSDCSLAFFDGF